MIVCADLGWLRSAENNTFCSKLRETIKVFTDYLGGCFLVNLSFPHLNAK